MKAEAICRELDRLEKDDCPFETLLETAVQRVHGMDDRFHWTGLYELFTDRALRLGPYIGKASGPETVHVGRGLRGVSIASRRAVVVHDILRMGEGDSSVGPGARLMVPIRCGDEIFGELEVESFLPETFDEKGLEEVTAVADRLARIFVRERELLHAGA